MRLLATTDPNSLHVTVKSSTATTNDNSIRTSNRVSSPDLIGESIPSSTLISHDKYTFPLLLAAMQSLCGALLTGYNTSVLNVPSAVIMSACDLSLSQYSSLQTFFCLGGLFGSMSIGKIADKFGRKSAHLVADIFFILSGASFVPFAMNNILRNTESYSSHSIFVLFIISRALCGIGSGISTSIIPTYLEEISPPQIRGSIGTLNQMTVCIGIVIGQIMGYSKIFGNSHFWPLLFTLNVVLPLLRIVTFWSFPESPKWLIIKGQKERANGILQHLRGCALTSSDVPIAENGDIDKQYGSLQVITNNIDCKMNKKRVFRRVICFNLCIAIGLQVLNQLSGINSVFFYSNVTLENAGLDSTFDLWIGTVAIGMANVIGVLPSTYLMDKWGRKTLLYLSLSGMIASSIGFSVCIINEYSYCSVVMLIFYVFAWEIGLGPIPWLLMAELAPSSHRALIVSVGTFTNFTLALVIAQFSNDIVEEFHYFPFAVVCLVGLLIIWKYVPETKGKTEAELQRDLAVITGH